MHVVRGEGEGGSSAAVQTQHCTALLAADGAVAVGGADLTGTGETEEVVATGNEGCANLASATSDAREGCTALG